MDINSGLDNVVMTRFRKTILNLFVALFLLTIIVLINWRFQPTLFIHLGYSVVFIIGLTTREPRLFVGVFMGFMGSQFIAGFDQSSLIISMLASLVYIFMSMTVISETKRTLQNVTLVVIGALLWVVGLSLMEFFLGSPLAWFEVVLNNAIVLVVNSVVALIITPLVQYIRDSVPRRLEG